MRKIECQCPNCGIEYIIEYKENMKPWKIFCSFCGYNDILINKIDHQSFDDWAKDMCRRRGNRKWD